MSTCYFPREGLKKARSEVGPESPGHLTEACMSVCVPATSVKHVMTTAAEWEEPGFTGSPARSPWSQPAATRRNVP